MKKGDNMNEPNSPENQTKKPSESPKKKFNFLWLILILVLLGGTLALSFYLDKNKGKEEENQISNFEENGEEYLWSEMDEGPYNDKISYATGNSLLNWTDSEIILAEHASVPDVILKDETLYVYFVDVSEDGKPEQIGLIRSLDEGETWEEKQFVTIEGLGEKVAVDPAPMLLDNGQIRLYYFDIAPTMKEGTQNNSIYSAISNDGINFVEEEGIRFKKSDIYDPDVIKINETWRMYVGTGEQTVLSAISSDGLNFTYEGVALQRGSIPNVIFENDTYYLFTGGIEVSTSTDGKTFSGNERTFDCGALTADPGVVKIKEGKYFMVYKTKDESNSNQFRK